MITLDVRDLAKLPGRLETVRKNATQVAGIIARDFTPEARAEVRDRFARREAPDGTAWAPRKHRYAHPPLELTGRLRRSIHVRSSGRSIRVRTPKAAPRYVFVQNEARQFLGFGEREQAGLTAYADDFLGRFVSGSLRTGVFLG